MYYLKADFTFGLPLIIVLGLIFSVWANTLFFHGMENSFDFYATNYINSWFYYPILLTHFIISLATSAALYNGFKTSNQKLIQAWMMIKLLECLSLGSGAVMFVARRTSFFFFFIGLIILAFGLYLLKSVKNASVNVMSDNNGRHTENKVPPKDAPPSYKNIELEQNLV